jgi:hypothetical protein
MKEIILSEEQIDKLTEMVRTLFSDYAENAIDEKGNYVYLANSINLEKHVISGTYFVTFNRDGGTERIHWLEFCIFYLQPKLKYYMSTYTIKSIGGKYIELLYDHFKLIHHANS